MSDHWPEEVRKYQQARREYEDAETAYRAKETAYAYHQQKAQARCPHHAEGGGSTYQYSTKRDGNRQVPCLRCCMCDHTKEVPE